MKLLFLTKLDSIKKKHVYVLLLTVCIFSHLSCTPKIELSFDKEIKGLLEYFDSERGNVYIRLKRSTDEYYFRGSYNYDYKPYSIENFFQINDSIFKPQNSDTIYIKRDEKEYYFIIGKIINKS